MLRKVLFLVLVLGSWQASASVTTVTVPGEASTTFLHLGKSQYKTSFTDTWALNFTNKATVASGAISLSLMKTYGISDFALAVLDKAGQTINVIETTSADNNGYWSFTIPSAGVYDLLISGVVTGKSGGAYVAGIVTSAIPEPGMYLLLGLGLVMLLIAKRRNSGWLPSCRYL